METNYASPFQIGNVTIPNRVVFAPMAGVSDLPFRLLCHEMGAGLVCMEMISAKAITFRSHRTGELWETSPEEKPVSLQIFGHEPDVMAEACRILEEQDFDILDINMGCPVPKIVNNQEGSALMKDPALIEKVVRACRENTSRPVTVKIRKGFDADHVNAVECALAAQEGGASAVAVHGRTRDQMYSGQADWTVIGDVKRAAKNDEFYTQYADIQKEVNAYLERGVILERPPRREIVKMILRHADMLCDCKGERVGMREMRGHVHNYLSGFPGASRVRKSVNSVTTKAQLQALLAKEYPYA